MESKEFENHFMEMESEKGIPNIMSELELGLKFIFKKWWLFAIAGLLAGGAGFLYAGSQKPMYKSQLIFALDEENSNLGGMMNIAAQFGINAGGNSIFSGDNILEIMISRRMITTVLLSIDTFNNKAYTLIEYLLYPPDDKESWNKKENIHFPVGQQKSTFSYQQDSLLFQVYKGFSKKNIVADRPNKKISIYEVSVITANEKLTKVFTDRIVSETNKYYVSIRTRKAKETLDVLEGRTEMIKGNLNSSISNKAAIQDDNLNPAFSAAQVPLQKQQVNIQVYGVAYSEMFKNLELARFQYLKSIPLMQIIDPADYPMKKIKLGKLKASMISAVSICFLIIFIFWLIRVTNLYATKET
jgi:hypothetical protein